MLDLDAVKARAAEAARHTNPGHHVDALRDSQQDVAALVQEVQSLNSEMKTLQWELERERRKRREEESARSELAQMVARIAGHLKDPLGRPLDREDVQWMFDEAWRLAEIKT